MDSCVYSVNTGRTQRTACRAVRERVSTVVRDASRAEGLTVRGSAGAGGPGARRAAVAGLRVPRAHRLHRLADRHLGARAARSPARLRPSARPCPPAGPRPPSRPRPAPRARCVIACSTSASSI